MTTSQALFTFAVWFTLPLIPYGFARLADRLTRAERR